MSNDQNDHKALEEQAQQVDRLNEKIQDLIEAEPYVTTGTVLLITINLVRTLLAHADRPETALQFYFDFVRMITEETQGALGAADSRFGLPTPDPEIDPDDHGTVN